MKTNKQYHDEDIVYPGIIAKQFKITMEQAYKKCEADKEKGLLRNVYFLRCPVCGHMFPTRYYTLNDDRLTEKQNCSNCGCEFMPDLENLFVLYERRTSDATDANM